MLEIRFQQDGLIESGLHEGYYVKFHDDTDVTGGYYILLVNHLEKPTDGGDYWMLDLQELESFAEAARWKIRWLVCGT
ncbi:hypothetical protein GCM10009827_077340 [Dactylosporangium maewongense]|uniref:Uncharacterized protein n=1 Tax=Dactylosporangium maewongense TaxID=634393 RepID=A0ABP4MJH2_9ACTN